jgi:hypothetical protein
MTLEEDFAELLLDFSSVFEQQEFFSHRSEEDDSIEESSSCSGAELPSSPQATRKRPAKTNEATIFFKLFTHTPFSNSFLNKIEFFQGD